MRTKSFLWLMACVLTAWVTACGSSSYSSQSTTAAAPANTSGSPASSAAASTAKITIDNFQFTSPQSVAPGATVTVVNSDQAEHSVTADQGNAFNVDIEGSKSATFTAPTQPGTYAYHCSYHPMMHGQLIVQ